MGEIYQDEQRSITVNEDHLNILRPGKDPVSVSLRGLRIVELTNSRLLAALKAANLDPKDYFALPYGPNQMAMPNCTKTAVEAVISDQQAREKKEREEYESPKNVERRRINELYAAADEAYSGAYCDPARSIQLRMEADKALDAWRDKYPEAAKEEKKTALIAQAEELEARATEALVYDADGWLDATEQQARHDDYMAQAEAIRADADKIS